MKQVVKSRKSYALWIESLKSKFLPARLNISTEPLSRSNTYHA